MVKLTRKVSETRGAQENQDLPGAKKQNVPSEDLGSLHKAKLLKPALGNLRHPLPPPIGPKLKQYRLKENLTLTDLQNLTGISNSTLSQIERGSVNPTFARVWRLTRSLGIGVEDLLGDVKTGLDGPHIYEHYKASSTPAITSADGLCTTLILSPLRRALPVEWYELVLKPGGSLRANAHGNGSWEHMTVIMGKVFVEIGDKEVLLEQGDTLRYSAEQPHGTRNGGETEARVMLVVVSLKELGVLGR
jgi:transcriptional regulator with XRE-family HTH domain